MEEIIEFRIPGDRYRSIQRDLPNLAGHVSRKSGWSVTLQFRDSRDEARQFYNSYASKFDEPPQLPYLKRTYTDKELASAELLRFYVWSLVEASGQEIGTQYDPSTACPACGSGPKQKGPLTLGLSKIPRQDFVMTLTGELLASRRARAVLDAAGPSGIRFGPVLSSATRNASNAWSQLFITARIPVSGKTVFGIDPFDLDPEGKYRCPACGLLGARLLSEVRIPRADWHGTDFAASSALVGVRLGLYEPWPLVVISPRTYRLLKSKRLSGFGVEVARLDP